MLSLKKGIITPLRRVPGGLGWLLQDVVDKEVGVGDDFAGQAVIDGHGTQGCGLTDGQRT